MIKLAGLLLIAATFAGCDDHESGSGHVITEKRKVETFTKISVAQNINVQLRQASNTEVKVETDDNLLEFVETSVDNGKLRIRIKDDISINNSTVTVYVSAPQINDISASSSANVEVKDILNVDGTLTLDASSAAAITAAVNAPDIKVSASSGSDVKLSGRTKNFSVNSSSGSSVKTSELLTENSMAEASSGATIALHASISVDGNASSGADITYRGGATIVKKQESSGGTMHKED